MHSTRSIPGWPDSRGGGLLGGQNREAHTWFHCLLDKVAQGRGVCAQRVVWAKGGVSRGRCERTVVIKDCKHRQRCVRVGESHLGPAGGGALVSSWMERLLAPEALEPGPHCCGTSSGLSARAHHEKQLGTWPCPGRLRLGNCCAMSCSLPFWEDEQVWGTSSAARASSGGVRRSFLKLI